MMLRWLMVFGVLMISPVVGAQEQPRTISTTGESAVYVTPDEVIVNFGVETFDAKLDVAKAENDRAAKALINAIRGLEIEQKHIQTAQLEVEIRYRSEGHPALTIEGYHARKAFSVTLKDVKKFEKLVDVALGNGANRLNGFEFRTTELRKHRDEARLMAVRAAKEKAQALAQELGCRVGAPRNIGEGYVAYAGYYGSRWGWAGANAQMMQNSVQVMPGGGDSGGETLPLGQIAVRAQVNVTFDLIPTR